MKHNEIEKLIVEHELWIDSDGRRGEKADFSGKTLKHGNFVGARLLHANFKGADLSYADFTGAVLWDTNFKTTKCFRTSFNRARLERSNFTEAFLREADFRRADCWESCFKDTTCTNTNFGQANLEAVNFTEADLISVNFQSSILDGVVGKQIITFSAGRHFAHYCDGSIKIGCITKSVRWWVDNYTVVGREHRYNAQNIKDYGNFIKFIATRTL